MERARSGTSILRASIRKSAKGSAAGTAKTGEKDAASTTASNDLPWYDDSGEETETTKMYCDAVISLAQSLGIKVDFVDNMGGARGVSKSGAIDVLKDTPMNSGMFNTLVHELAHELLHQRYISNKDTDPNGYGQYFIGKEQGRAVVEQQAELCAWLVLRNFGYDMPTNINYVGMWGLDENNAMDVFDTVAKVTNAIILGIHQRTSSLQESFILLKEITGREIAELVGMEDLYDESEENSEESKLKRENFKESFNKVFNTLTDLRSRNLGQPFRL